MPVKNYTPLEIPPEDIFFTTTCSNGQVVEFFLDKCEPTADFLDAMKPETIIKVWGGADMSSITRKR